MASAPTDADTVDGMMRFSDLALYWAKSKQLGKAQWFDETMQQELLKKRRIEEELRSALLQNQFMLYYQPIIDARDLRVTCCEALPRWRHPERGMISPAEFIPVAEETGMIVELGEWVLRRACNDALLWPEHVRVAVNLSPRQFQQKDLADMIKATVVATRLPPERLEVEITETTLMQDTADVARKITDLADFGVRISLDDFGTGYSSLGYLNRYPVKKLKLDRSFATQMADSPKTQAIVGAISILARDLGIELIAEGVETNEELALFAAKNVFIIQGYFFSRPKPIEELLPRLANWAAPLELEGVA